MARTHYIAGNWKMFKTRDEALSFIYAVADKVPAQDKVDSVVCAPFVLLRCLVKRQGENLRIGAQNMHFEEKIKKTFVYYDTPDFDLQKSNIVLYKTQIGNFTELNMATEKVNSKFRYTLRTNYKHFTKQIKMHDSILKHKEF